MANMMTFPDTWEEYEEVYGFTDTEQIYTNGSRLMQSFRVKQWLDHLEMVQTEPQTEVLTQIHEMFAEMEKLLRKSSAEIVGAIREQMEKENSDE